LKLEMESLVWKGRERRISLRFQIGDPSRLVPTRLAQDCCSDRDSKHTPTSRASNPERMFVMEWGLKLE
jgi:hypothetical protein